MSDSTTLVKVYCPSCQKKLGFPQDAVGRKARCPQCRQTFRVEPPPFPAPAATSAPRAPASPAAPAVEGERLTVHCPDCNKKLRLPLTALGKKAQCPACQETFPVQPPAPEPAAAPVSASGAHEGTEENDGLYDFLADAENKAEALTEQPPAPAGFKPAEMPSLKSEASSGSSRAGSGRATAKDVETKAPAMERLYGVLGSLGTGCALSAAGALIGAFIWYGIARAFEIELGYVAWAVGGLAGLGMHIGVRNESAVAGLLAACFALAGIIAGKLMYVAWVFMPELQAEARKEMNSVEHQREVLVTQETEQILKAKKINPAEAEEEQEEAATAEAEKRIEKLSSAQVRERYQKYVAQHPGAESDGKLPSLREVPTGLIVIFFGLLFGFRGLIFVILGMVTAFKIGYNGGSFGN